VDADVLVNWAVGKPELTKAMVTTVIASLKIDMILVNGA